MRAFLFLFSAILMAQTPAPKSPAPAPKAATPATDAKTKAPTAAKSAAKAKAPAAAPGALTTDDQKTVYALGLSIAQQISRLDLSRAELEIVKQAMTDAAAGKPAIELSTWAPKINGLATARSARVAAQEKTKSKAYLVKAAAEPGATRTPSGLVYSELAAGTGPSPKATDKVKVHYRGTLVNGTEFDSSYKRNAPAEFPLNGVIPCWTEGVQRMKVGGKSRLVCPSEIAYGDTGNPSIPGGATLIFEVELLAINP
ncbi:MAG: peptidylprolyl isomerase, FKBP-type [Bryobacterales bacterium]|nr:peptidylprolyl isomerase, FKBP-type [Bryobacterales bacterium]